MLSGRGQRARKFKFVINSHSKQLRTIILIMISKKTVVVVREALIQAQQKL